MTHTVMGGRLGIGEASPQARLELRPKAEDAFTLRVSSQDGTAALSVSRAGFLGLGTDAPAYRLHLGQGSLKLDSGGAIVFADGSVMNSAGVGSASSLSGNGDISIVADADSNGSGQASLMVGSAQRMVIANSGFIGINTPSPSSLLHITGGNLTVTNGDVAASNFSGSGSGLTNLNWSGLVGLPPACPSGEFVSGLGGTLSCAPPTVPASAVTSGSIADGSVTTVDIAPGAVDSGKILDGSVTSADLAASAVTSSDLAANAVDSTKIADGSVTSADLADGTVAAVDLAANAVDSTKIADGSVTSADLADGTVATVDLAANAVDSTKIADGSVTSADVADGSLQGPDLADGSVPLVKLAQSGCAPGELAKWSGTAWACASDATGAASGSVTSAELADGSVAAVDLAANAVDSTKSLGAASAGGGPRKVAARCVRRPWRSRHSPSNSARESVSEARMWESNRLVHRHVHRRRCFLNLKTQPMSASSCTLFPVCRITSHQAYPNLTHPRLEPDLEEIALGHRRIDSQCLGLGGTCPL